MNIKTKKIIVALVSIILWCSSSKNAECDTISLNTEEEDVIYHGSFTKQGSARPGEVILSIENIRQEKTIENEMKDSSPEMKEVIESINKRKKEMLKRHGMNNESNQITYNHINTFEFNGRTGDKTFEIVTKYLTCRKEDGKMLENSLRLINSNKQPVYFDGAQLFDLQDGIKLKMIKLEGNNLIYQLIAPENLRNKINDK